MDTSIEKNRVITPPLVQDNLFLKERIEELEIILDEKNDMIEDLYQEIINLKNRIEIIESKVLTK